MVMLKRDAEKFGYEVYKFQSLGEFYRSIPVTGVQAINYGGAILDVLYINKNSATTLVIFHAALVRRTVTYPVFSGRSISRNLDANIIMVSDPSLSLGLDLAWFAGNRNQQIQRDLPNVMRHIIMNQASPQRVVFFGASGGGFAALYYSHGFPGSTAITMNPQINIAAYTPGPVKEYAQVAWGRDSIENITAVTNLGELYSEGLPNRVLYLQNFRDAHHRKNHIVPWLAAIPKNSPSLFLLLDDWGRGHIPPPKDLTHRVLLAAITGDDTILAKEGFVRAPEVNAPYDAMNAWRASVS